MKLLKPHGLNLFDVSQTINFRTSAVLRTVIDSSRLIFLQSQWIYPGINQEKCVWFCAQTTIIYTQLIHCCCLFGLIHKVSRNFSQDDRRLLVLLLFQVLRTNCHSGCWAPWAKAFFANLQTGFGHILEFGSWQWRWPWRRAGSTCAEGEIPSWLGCP